MYRTSWLPYTAPYIGTSSAKNTWTVHVGVVDAANEFKNRPEKVLKHTVQLHCSATLTHIITYQSELLQ